MNLAESHCTLKELGIDNHVLKVSFGGEEEEEEADEAFGTRVTAISKSRKSTCELERKTGSGEGQEEAIAMAP